MLIAVAAWLLALIGGGALFVSFSAQYAYIVTVRRRDAASVIEALLLDLLMIVFTLLALGLSRAGSPPGPSGPDPGLRGRVVVHERVRRRRGQPPVGRRVRGRPGRAGRGGGPGRGGDPPPRPGRPRTLGLDHPGPRRGGRGQDHRAGAAVLSAVRPGRPGDGPGPASDGAGRHPAAGLPETPAPEAIEPPRTKKAVLLALYRAHPDYGDRSTASRVAAELAPQAGLQAGTARSYLYAELDDRAS